jgi:hypothetical protein
MIRVKNCPAKNYPSEKFSRGEMSASLEKKKWVKNCPAKNCPAQKCSGEELSKNVPPISVATRNILFIAIIILFYNFIFILKHRMHRIGLLFIAH